MKAYLLAAVLIASTFSVFATDAGFNPEAYLAANPDVKAAGYTAYQHINMISGFELTARLAATAALVNKANAAGEVKVMFCDCIVFNEASTIQDAQAWYVSSPDGKTTAKALIQSGWRLQNTFSINAKQYFFVFVR